MKGKRLLKIIASVVLGVSMTFTLSACGTGAVAGKDTLVVAHGADAKTLDPHGTNDQPSSRVSKQIYDRLVEQTETMEIVPGLAKEWKQLDNLTWEFKLRDGVKFHNGEVLKASDVVFTLNRMKNSKSVSSIISSVDTITAKDDSTVIIKTKEPFAPLLSHLTHTAASILNEKAVKDAGQNYGQNPVGTGVYKFESWDAGSKINLVRNEDYFGEKGKTPKIVFRNVKEGTNRTIGLETGEIDIAYDVEPVDTKSVREHKQLQLIEEESLSYTHITMNNKKEPFNNPKVRKALNYAVDKDALIGAILYGAGVKANAPIGKNVFGYTDKTVNYDYDVAKAKELLKEAGLENGFKTSIWTNDNPVRVQIAQIIQANLKDVGIDAEIVSLEWGTFLEKTARGEHDMSIGGWTTVTGDADYALYPLYHSSQHGGAGNRDFYSNKEVDKLLEDAKKSIDPVERKDLYEKAIIAIMDDVPELVLYYGKQNVGARKEIEGFKLHPAGHHNLSKVEKK
ncbi:glutathione ABC transporter substrate-binding protein [Clostridium hydrogeniformans]|uniref:glutathione ABC transporter substrate-binding protein n=1 Tax=Clostridium hydrogeniformans TaxID=349933 RepID=UPI0004836820|nr:glutathione ABC transporter substrate-binding protein [Clostridium hydrogeniformans]